MSKTCRLRSLLLFLISFVVSSVFASEDLSLWLKRMSITFSGYEKEEVLTNFPALIILEETNAGVGFSYNDFLSPPYADLRFASEDKETPLDFEVESWDLNGKSYVWVKIPELTQDTKIYAFWGQEGVDLPSCTTDGSVWSEDYLGVWHMNDATSTTITDSTANGFNGTKKGADNPTEEDTIIGKGQLFNKSYIDLTGMTDQTRVYTFSMWVNVSDVGEYLPIDIETGRLLINWSRTGANIGFFDGGGYRLFGPTPVLTTWHHMAFRCAQGSISMYLNGEKYGLTLPHDNKAIGGAIAFGARYSGNDNFFPGMLDEFRISTKVRSPDWIWACWKNQGTNNDFVDYGLPISQALPRITNAHGATDITPNSARLTGNLVSTGMSATVVSVYWGDTDGGDNPDNWQRSNTWDAPQMPGLFFHEVIELNSDSFYYYRFMAANNAGRLWAEKTSVFMTSEVWLEKISDANFLGCEPAEILVHRRNAVMDEKLDVYYSIEGTALPGVEYVELPGVVTIPAGETSTTITVQPLPGSVTPKTKNIRLELLFCIQGDPATANVTIAGENLNTWQKTMEISFPGYNKDTDLVNFPALIVLAENDFRPGFSYSDFLSPPYGDLRFTADDKKTQLAFEVESWDNTGESYVWVKIPELTQGTRIYAFWGKEGTALPPCTTDGSVWSEDYLGVWHMNDATSTTIADATGHGFNGIKKGSDSPLEVDAVIGKGQLFDKNYIDLTGLDDVTRI
ncbi:MAG: DUF2341 domain-containing protein, partial [Lentisphaerae bacterium]|nr:DUF2341 domain-containing protein [Lentisphaerota bacterium]